MKMRLKAWRQGMFNRYDSIASSIRRWEHRCAEKINQQTFLKRLSLVFKAATYFGDGYLWLFIALWLAIFGTNVDRRIVVIMFIVTVLNIVFFRLSKFLTKRDRPESEKAQGMKFRYVDNYSFPSGHATTSFGMAYMLALFYPFLWVQISVYAAATLIGFSRIYLGEHYPSDVIFGAVLGTIASIVMVALLGNIIPAF